MTTNFFAPLGFVPMRNKGAIGGVMNEYQILSTDTSLIGLNDLVKLSSGYITKAGPTDTPIGIFQGWNFRTRSITGGSQGSAADGRIVPWFKAWTGAVTVNTNQMITCLVDDDPWQTFRVQAAQTINALDRGKLVDLVDCPGGPDIAVFGRGKQAVGTPTTYYNITAYTVSDGGSAYVQNGVDLLINGVIQDMRPADIVVTAGVVQSITPLNQVQGLPTNTPTSTIQAKPGFAGTGGTITTTKSGAQTAAQFRIERVIEQPFRSADSANNTTGYDLSTQGLNSWLEVSFAKHGRGATVAAG